MTKDNLTERRVDEFLDQHMTLTGSTTQLTMRNVVREMLVRYGAQQQALLEECAEQLERYKHFIKSSVDDGLLGNLWRNNVNATENLLSRLRADHG